MYATHKSIGLTGNGTNIFKVPARFCVERTATEIFTSEY